jgi:hypothetical protein
MIAIYFRCDNLDLYLLTHIKSDDPFIVNYLLVCPLK